MITAEQKIKREILLLAADLDEEYDPGNLDTSDAIEAAWDDGVADSIQDATEEVRCGYTEETDIPSEYSRHYESDSVARQMRDGSFVGWTYWHGGGKFGEPSAIDWIEHAYDLDVTEEEKLVVVRTFKKREPE